MYLTNKHIFIHLNKSAGCFVKDFMTQYMGAKIVRYKHAPLRMMPEKYRKTRIKFGVTRNPFSWYVSYYHYHQQEAGTYKDITFKEYVMRHTMNPRPLLSLMGKKVRKKFPLCYPPKTDLKIGAWQFHHINYFKFDAWDILTGKKEWDCSHDLDVLLKTEGLKKQLIWLFGEKYKSKVQGFKKRNRSNHKKYQKYYDNEMIDLINKREGLLMERLGYSYE